MHKTMLEAIQDQNRLLSEQNRLLREAAIIETSSKNINDRRGMMTEYDCQLICMSDDILAAIARWNTSRGHGRGRKKQVVI
jgi:hypothetical protein